VVLQQEVDAPAPPLAVVVTVGVQNAALMHALGRLAAVHEGLILRHAGRDGSGFPGPALPAAFRLAWICVNGQDVDLPVVRQCYRELRAVAPVTISVFGASDSDLMAGGACDAFPHGVILQPYTVETLPHVPGVIGSFLSGPRARPSPDSH
jgi:hypothetical protein